MIDKFFSFKRIRSRHQEFERRFSEGMRQENVDAPLQNILRYGSELAKENLSDEKLSMYLERFAGRELDTLENNLSLLSVAAIVGPFMGLLGTVWGLLVSFTNMAAAGSSSIKVVASGVAEALITTVVGLLVAIPAAVGHNYYADMLKKISAKMEFFLPYIVAFLRENKK